jgi:uncharacterized protein
MQYLNHSIKGFDVVLSYARVLYVEKFNSLVVTDTHFGKTAHFRKEGINIPHQVFSEDLMRLFNAIHFFKPKQVIIIGDMFHSYLNSEVEHFKKWRSAIGHIEIILVKGNHDILPVDAYEQMDVNVVEKVYTIDKFNFVHDIIDMPESGFSFVGHVHPSIVLDGKGKQRIKLPCFFVTDEYCILPAFGKFTGTKTMELRHATDIFAVHNQAIIKVK